MKKIFFIAAALIFMTPAAFAQSAGAISGSSASTTVGTAATAMNVIMPGSGSAAAAASSNLGSLANPQWIMGQSTIAPSMTTYDACQQSRSLSVLSVGGGWTQTIDDCVKQRQAEWLASHGKPALAMQEMCRTKFVLEADKDSPVGQEACWQTVLDRKAESEKHRHDHVASVATPAVVVSDHNKLYTAPSCPTRTVNGKTFVACN